MTTDFFFVGSMLILGLIALVLGNWLWGAIFFAIAVVMRLITIVERRFGFRDYNENPVRLPWWGISAFFFFPMAVMLFWNGKTGPAVGSLIAGGCLLGIIYPHRDRWDATADSTDNRPSDHAVSESLDVPGCSAQRSER